MAKKYKYRNISDVEQNISYIGNVLPGKIVETDEPINNPNFKLETGASYDGLDKVKKTDKNSK